MEIFENCRKIFFQAFELKHSNGSTLNIDFFLNFPRNLFTSVVFPLAFLIEHFFPCHFSTESIIYNPRPVLDLSEQQERFIIIIWHKSLFELPFSPFFLLVWLWLHAFYHFSRLNQLQRHNVYLILFLRRLLCSNQYLFRFSFSSLFLDFPSQILFNEMTL